MSDHNSGLAYLSVLGVCPLLAKATTLLTGITMGLASLCILFFTILSVSSCRRYIVYGFRLPAILLISVTWVTVLDLFMQALCYELRLTLGIYLPLLAMNSFILLSLEQTALTTPSSMALKATLPRGLAILGVLGIIGALRELLGLGGLLSDATMFGMGAETWTFVDGGFALLPKAPGALFGLGLFIAAYKYYRPNQAVANAN